MQNQWTGQVKAGRDLQRSAGLRFTDEAVSWMSAGVITDGSQTWTEAERVWRNVSTVGILDLFILPTTQGGGRWTDDQQHF